MEREVFSCFSELADGQGWRREEVALIKHGGRAWVGAVGWEARRPQGALSPLESKR